MMTLIIVAGSDPALLVPTMQSVFPAIAVGVVRDGIVVSPAGAGEVAAVADAAGCEVFEGEPSEAFAAAVAAARADHALVLEAGSALETDWWREAARHLERRLAEGPRAARFTPAAPGEGRFFSLRSLAALFMPANDLRCGLIAPVSMLRRSPRFPPALKPRPVRLRSRIYRVAG